MVKYALKGANDYFLNTYQPLCRQTSQAALLMKRLDKEYDFAIKACKKNPNQVFNAKRLDAQTAWVQAREQHRELAFQRELARYVLINQYQFPF